MNYFCSVQCTSVHEQLHLLIQLRAHVAMIWT